MKKLFAIMTTVVVAMSLAACSGSKTTAEETTMETAVTEATGESESKTDAEKAKSEDTDYAALVSPETNKLMLYVDGADVTDGIVTFDQMKDKFSVVEMDGVSYYATSISNLCAYDLSPVVAFFGETTDGFVRYYTDLENAQIAVLMSEDGETFTQIMNEDAPSYAMVLPGSNVINGLSNIFMLTKSADFSVPIKVNGEEIGAITLSDFMKKTPVGEKKVTTAMYDGSFKYKGGEATYKGRFLGIDFETMLAKLAALGMELPEAYTEVEFYGTPGMGEPGKNTEYALTSDDSNYFGNMEFFCMYDGKVNDPDIKGVDMGLSAFINGTGQRWVTYDLTEINFVTE